MRILAIEPKPFHSIRYAFGAGIRCQSASLPFHRALVDELPDSLQAIVVTGDLQGVVEAPSTGEIIDMLSNALCRELRHLRSQGRLPAREATAALLAGDLHAYAGEADVTGVWHDLAEVCRWIAGVAGNHDLPPIRSGRENGPASDRGAMHFLHQTSVKLDGLLIGGVSGVIGERGLQSHSEREFVASVVAIAQQHPDVMVMHDGPNVAGTDVPGWPSIRRALEAAPPTLVIRGHDHWPTPLATLANETQVLNVEGRVIVIQRGSGRRAARTG
jgi:Icc protein